MTKRVEIECVLHGNRRIGGGTANCLKQSVNVM